MSDRITAAVGDATSSVASAGHSIASKITGGAASVATDFATGVESNWAQATSKINAIDDKIESKYSSVAGWGSISSDLHNAIASGTKGVAAFFSTQTAIAGSAASSINSDVASAIIAAVTTTSTAGGASPSTSGNAAPRMMVGSVVGVVGVIAGVALL